MNRERHSSGLRLSRRDMLKLLAGACTVLVNPAGKAESQAIVLSLLYIQESFKRSCPPRIPFFKCIVVNFCA